jgi:folate-binding Fe-S cluster repair protein YgfZ
MVLKIESGLQLLQGITAGKFPKMGSVTARNAARKTGEGIMEFDSFVYYRSFFEAIDELPDIEYAMISRAINKYALNGEIVELAGVCKALFTLIKPQIDEDNRRTLRMKELNRTIKRKKGIEHHNWKGGITPENHKIRQCADYKHWRKAVFDRNNYICQECFQRGGSLNAHHIRQFSKHPELRLNVDNGITLCKKCHIKWHRENGR